MKSHVRGFVYLIHAACTLRCFEHAVSILGQVVCRHQIIEEGVRVRHGRSSENARQAIIGGTITVRSVKALADHEGTSHNCTIQARVRKLEV